VIDFKRMSKDYVNFGKDKGMDPEVWWKRLIKSTLNPFLDDVMKSKGDWDTLSERLWQNFSTDQGYELHEDARNLLKHLRQVNQTQAQMQYIVGVITNSDPRVSKILTSMGLVVSPSGAGGFNSDATGKSTLDKDNDLQFVITSYDVGHRKPHLQIFKAAEDTARTLLDQQGHGSNEDLLKVYIGDDYEYDVIGATHAGWNPILIDRPGTHDQNDHVSSHELLSHVNKADSTTGKPLHFERVKSLWPFSPAALETIA
jgi:FMN phosphatase YigB (HAD superfamily)